MELGIARQRMRFMLTLIPAAVDMSVFHFDA
jgi:hypothetical protein